MRVRQPLGPAAGSGSRLRAKRMIPPGLKGSSTSVGLRPWKPVQRSWWALVVPVSNCWIIPSTHGHHVAGVWGEAPGLRAFASRSTPCVRFLEGSASSGVTALVRLRTRAPEGPCPDDHRPRATQALPGGSAPRQNHIDPGISGEVRWSWLHRIRRTNSRCRERRRNDGSVSRKAERPSKPR